MAAVPRSRNRSTKTRQMKLVSRKRIQPDRISFALDFNPDVFCGQMPQTDEEKEEWANDEKRVRQVCDFLHETIIPGMVSSWTWGTDVC